MSVLFLIARKFGLETGQVDIVPMPGVPFHLVSRLDQNSDIRVTVLENSPSRQGGWLDHLSPPFNDARVRRAVQMAYPVEDALIAGVGDPRFWRTCPSVMMCGSKFGGMSDYAQIYNAQDIEGAKALIEEAGMTGAKVIVLSPEDMLIFPQEALVTKQIFEQLGFDVEFKAIDWATQSQWRQDPELFSIFHTSGGFSWGGFSPLLNSTLHKNKYWNKYQDESGNMTRLMEQYARATSEQEQRDLILQIQKQFYEDIPYLNIGETLPVTAERTTVHGATINYGTNPNLYNAWSE